MPAIPFILTGFELGETQPINTGLGFSSEQLAEYPAHKLPLFSEWAFNWTRPDNLIKSVKHALKLRQTYESVIVDRSSETFVLGYADNSDVLVFSRRKGDEWISVIANSNHSLEQRARVVLDLRPYKARGLWGTGDADVDVFHEVLTEVSLVPNYVLILDAGRLPR